MQYVLLTTSLIYQSSTEGMIYETIEKLFQKYRLVFNIGSLCRVINLKVILKLVIILELEILVYKLFAYRQVPVIFSSQEAVNQISYLPAMSMGKS